MAAPERRGGAARDDAGLEPGGAERVERLRHASGQRREVGGLVALDHADVARIEHHPAEGNALGAGRGAGERDQRFDVLHPDAAEPHVHLHEDAHRPTRGGGRRGERREHLARVQRHLQVHLGGKRHQARELRGPHGRIGEEEVGREGCHHLGLAERGHREPARAGVQLDARDRPRLVRLDVGAPGETVGARIGRDPPGVRPGPSEVDEADRRLDRLRVRALGTPHGAAHGVALPRSVPSASVNSPSSGDTGPKRIQRSVPSRSMRKLAGRPRTCHVSIPRICGSTRIR